MEGYVTVELLRKISSQLHRLTELGECVVNIMACEDKEEIKRLTATLKASGESLAKEIDKANH